jgi:2-amino-4-hydroxy-6-hydroxymethyldihydropteridine diphosphokinase
VAGRKRAEPWGPRSLDIDLLTYGDATIAVPGLTVPHPHLAERAFVLVPLAEIAPQLRIAGRTIAALRDAIDTRGVRRDAFATARLATLFTFDRAS